ncbi:glycosyltransferase family A protein [Maritimibacter sp. HL-12]|uniref:glycosyltransferase family 2 protein n=1 Tax=Maritimibacter sp. HL-12 TaxID=1162418 RepID=UPI000A0EED2F|nr:glycosyltransferase family A protein [Maritimibacter sp. HL-12]SMH56163.1 Glycosyltransferase involved in cell wall bisynthesis [Maritimibacter sp. HL-12]
MTEAPPKVSVVCAWYNRADFIRDTIDSLLAQDYPNFDITVVNDGSPDPRVREILDSYDDPRLRVIHQDNTGFTRAIRRAIDESDGEYIAIQGAGDLSLPRRLSAQVEAITIDNRFSIVGCWYSDQSENSESEVLRRPEASCERQMAYFMFSQGELMYRRKTYDSVGGYRTLFTVGQGADLWMRMLRTTTSYVLEDKLYIRRLFADGVSNNSRKLRLRNELTKLRIASEIYYRRTNIDPIDEYGQYAPLFLFKATYSVRVFLGLEVLRNFFRFPRK